MKKRFNSLRWLIVELWDDSNRFSLSHWLCGFGFHWHIVWSDHAEPGSYDPPAPPEAGTICAHCGELHHYWRDRLYWIPKERLLRRLDS